VIYVINSMYRISAEANY